MKYVFYENNEAGVVNVSAEMLYGKSGASGMTDAKFGFVTERNRNNSAYLKIPELTSGFVPAPCFGTGEVTEICQDSCGCYVKSKYDGLYPLSFRIGVDSEGVYSVTVKVCSGDETDGSVTTNASGGSGGVMIFSNNRQLVFRGNLKSGVSIVKTFPVAVYPIIPRNYTKAADTTGITVTVIGRGVRLQSVEIVKKRGASAEGASYGTPRNSSLPVLWIAGDSTVTDQCCDYPYVSGASYAGWGQMLPSFVGNEYAVSNNAHSGLTLESFRSEGHWEIVKSRMRRKDLVLFQFGHNDQKLAHLTAEGGYRRLYTEYIGEVREAGGIPVIVTPLARNTWKGDGESYNDLLSAYNDECVRLGKELDVPVVALHDAAAGFIVRNGREAVKKYFYPSDYTHTNDYGAYFFASIVYCELVRLGVLDEGIKAAAINTENPLWTAPERVVMPELLPEFLSCVPAGEDPLAGETDLDKVLTRAESLALVVKAMKFFSVNVYNDTFTDVVGHEPYAGVVECGVQNGIIPAEDVAAKRFRPEDNVTGEEFLAFAQNGYRSRQPGNVVGSIAESVGLRGKSTVLKKEAITVLRALKV